MDLADRARDLGHGCIADALKGVEGLRARWRS